MINNMIDRDTIYVGSVVNLIEVKRNENTVSKDRYIPTIYDKYRSMIFTIDNNGFACDLLYESPRYAVLNHTDIDISFDRKVVIDAVFIGPLLKKLGFNKDLTFNDIKYIERVIFNKKALDKYCYVFGLVPNNNDYKVIGWHERGKQKSKYNIGPYKLYREMTIYRNAINKHGSDSKKAILTKGFKASLNAFKPPRKEGKIKVLKKY